MSKVIQTSAVKNLFSATKTILDHNREIERIKGEKFNIFSILKMDTKENLTHSNFLGELLNPNGSHLKGDRFLQLFLNEIQCNHLELSSATVYLEHFIGKRCDTEKVGGRIDIYIEDKFKNSVSIENKIHAIDQYAQIERYVKHNKSKNRVYYLNLHGTSPHPDSKGDLDENEHYFIISYRENIVNWLNECLRESADIPILRETIRQYILLIKKLTSTMNENEEQALIRLILNNFEEANYIAANYSRAKESVCEDIRTHTITQLRSTIGERYDIFCGNSISTKYAQIWIKPKGIENPQVFFGIESFSGNSEYSNLFIGTFIHLDSKKQYKKLNTQERNNMYWADSLDIRPFDNYASDLSQPKFVQILASDETIKNRFVDHIIEEMKQYLSIHEQNVIDYLKSI